VFLIKEINYYLLMKVLESSLYVGATVVSTLVLTSVTASIFGNESCKRNFDNWKVLGTVGSLGSFLGSYYYSLKKY
tara:strand:+ start:115 stop:342 length:228 start_codon:yes stop_codon:yes gene_type:complete